jgi:uncharacterized membrane protein YesL
VKRISHGTIGTIAGVAYLGLITNVLLVIASLPVVLLLITTDPALSWPLLAAAAPLCAPALSAAFHTFREFDLGGVTPGRAFVAGWRSTWRRAFTLGALVTGVVVVVVVDVRFFSDSQFGVAVVPALGLLAVIAAAVGLVGLVAIADAPQARLRDILRASLYLSMRRWYLTVVSLVVLVTQVVLFTAMPAVALGLTAAPALYLAWANSRYTLRPVLETEELPAV